MAETEQKDSAAGAADATRADAPSAPPPPGEIAVSNDLRDITLGWTGRMRPMQDSVLAARGGGLEIYEETLRDWQCYSAFQQRRRAVVSKEWDVAPGAGDRLSVMAAESLKAQLDAISFDAASDMMLFGLWYGYAVSECMWTQDGREAVLDRIKVRKARRFRYDMDGNLRLLTRADMIEGEFMPPRKFWTFRTGADNDDDPYGLGLGHYCYWPVWLKRNGYRFWTLFLDKFGMPTGVGTYPPGASREDQVKLLGAIAAIQSSSGIIIPEGMAIQLLEAQRSGSSGNDGFVDRMDAAIAKVILSQTMTTDNGSSRSQSETHMDVREEVVKGDADLVCNSFNQGPAKWLTDWNYPGAVPPRVWRDIEPPEDLDALAERDAKIYALGFEPDEDYIRKTYGEGWTRRQATAPSVLPGLPGNPRARAEAAPAFAERRLDPAAALALQTGREAAAAIGEMIDEIREILATSADFAEFEQRMLLAHPGMPAEKLAAVLRDAMTAADLTGRADQEERG